MSKDRLQLTTPKDFLSLEKAKQAKKEVIYLPPVLDRRIGTAFAYPRTIINGLIHQRRLPITQAIMLEEHLVHTFQDHYDADAIAGGSLVAQAVFDTQEAMEELGMTGGVKLESLSGRTGSAVEHEMVRLLRKKENIIIGDEHHALLLIGMAPHHHAQVIDPYPDPFETNFSSIRVIDLSPVGKAVSRQEGVAFTLRATKFPIW